jgi:hypothetical protein
MPNITVIVLFVVWKVIWADPLAALFFLRGSNAAGLLGLRVRIPPWAWMVVFVNVVCCQVEVSATGRSLVQRRPIECVCVTKCDHVQQ